MEIKRESERVGKGDRNKSEKEEERQRQAHVYSIQLFS